MIFYILLEVQFQAFLIGHVLESRLFVPCDHWYQGNIFHQNCIPALIRHCFLYGLEKGQLKPMRKCEKHDHNND